MTSEMTVYVVEFKWCIIMPSDYGSIMYGTDYVEHSQLKQRRLKGKIRDGIWNIFVESVVSA